MSCRSADCSVDLEERTGARAAQAETPSVLPERSMWVRFEEDESGSMCFWRSVSVSILRPLPAREKVEVSDAIMVEGGLMRR